MCATINHASARTCPSCGHAFEIQIKITASAADADILEKAPKSNRKWLNVHKMHYSRHTKTGSPDSVLVIYDCGLTKIKDWVCVEHSGFAGRKAKNFLDRRGYKGPLSVAGVLANKGQILKAKTILVDFSSRYPNIQNTTF